MKRPWGALSLLFCLPSLCIGQSLGAAAQKEHERRDKVREKGAPSRTVTDEDLASTRGTTADEPATSPTPAEEAPDEARTDGETMPTVSPERFMQVPREAAPHGDGEAYWHGRLEAAKNRVAETKYRYDRLQRMIFIGQPARTDSNGRRAISSIYQMKERADAAEVELRAAEKALEDLYDEGRRAGALPGWLR